ncbi:MAG TPA: hypothetical protein VFH78_11420 [Candidatus Thermoplasmatota archaeon]|nr:hypothetical protein [Candidatus Thermoplasmatota archaeon]
MAPPTVRLYWESPTAKTAIATVTGHAGGGFTLDRTLYHAPLAGYHHAQPCDLGHVLAEGHKLKLTKVFWDAHGRLVHRTSGPLPKVGARAQLHLDAERRELQARAHAAMHLLVTAAAESHATFLDAPAVVGGGEARVTVRFREDPAVALPRVVARAQQLADAREDVTAKWAPREDAAKLVTEGPVPLDAVMPAEPSLRLVQCGKRSVLPCDAPLCAHTWDVGPMRLALVQRKGEGVRFGVKVA